MFTRVGSVNVHQSTSLSMSRSSSVTPDAGSGVAAAWLSPAASGRAGVAKGMTGLGRDERSVPWVIAETEYDVPPARFVMVHVVAVAGAVHPLAPPSRTTFTLTAPLPAGRGSHWTTARFHHVLDARTLVGAGGLGNSPPSAAIAAIGSMSPEPNSSSRPFGPRSSAVSTRRPPGFTLMPTARARCSASAAAPATCGVAMDVPFLDA